MPTRITLDLTPEQAKVLREMSDLYGKNMTERARHILVDGLAEHKRRLDEAKKPGKTLEQVIEELRSVDAPPQPITPRRHGRDLTFC